MGIAKYDVTKVTEEQLKEIKVVGTERTRYFDGIGKNVSKATDLETAIQLSGMDFEVQKQPMKYKAVNPGRIQLSDEEIRAMLLLQNEEVEEMQALNRLYQRITGIDIRQLSYTDGGNTLLYDKWLDKVDEFTNTRTDTEADLGTVGKTYTNLQNLDAYAFLDSLVGEAKYETAGTYGKNGSKSFITMSTEPMKILNDEFAPYLLFTNSFDGSGSVRCLFTPIRIFCSNCIARALKNADFVIKIQHSSSMEARLEAAKEILLGNSNYMNAIKAEAEKMVKISYSNEQFKIFAKSVADRIIKIDEKSKAGSIARNECMYNAILTAYNQPDLQNYNGTAYKGLQALADFESHMPSFKESKDLILKNFNNIQNMIYTNEFANMALAM